MNPGGTGWAILKYRFIENPGGKTFSVLKGRLNDQAALAGILNSLYELHHVVMEVQIVKDTKDKEDIENSL